MCAAAVRTVHLRTQKWKCKVNAVCSQNKQKRVEE